MLVRRKAETGPCRIRQQLTYFKAKSQPLTETLGKLSAENLKHAHRLLESGKARGKIMLEGY